MAKKHAKKPRKLDVLLTVEEVAEVLRIHPRTVYRLIAEGRMPGKAIPEGHPPLAGKRPIRVRERELYEWLEDTGYKGVADVRDRRRKQQSAEQA